VGTIVQAITTLGVSIIMALVLDWRLGLVSFPFIPFVLAAVYLQSKILMGQSVTESKTLQEAGKVSEAHLHQVTPHFHEENVMLKRPFNFSPGDVVY